MSKRKYELKDIYDYLKQEYDFEWRAFQIRDWKTEQERDLKKSDFKRGKEDDLFVVAIVYQGDERKTILLHVDNDVCKVSRINSYPNHKEPEVKWRDFLAERYNQEQSL